MTTIDEQALLSLVQAAEGKAWSTSLNGWSSNSGIPVCDWEGITCRISMEGGPAVVAEVFLASKELSGTIPTELGLLSELEHLTLKNNILQGSIPQEVANLKKLVTLDLTECFLTGTLPQRFESYQLTKLLLANNAISGHFFETDDSPHLQSIKEIRMENNLLTGTLHGPSLVKLPHLDTLSLSDNDLSGLLPGEELGSLPNLRYLYADTNHFVGPLPNQLAQVGRSQILELWVQDNALSGTVPASYVRFDALHDFFIDGNKLTGALPPDLCGPEINSDFFNGIPPEAERNYCDSIACPAGSVALEGVYPCEKCPGGEAARLKNRYLGQTGQCSNYTQRDVLKIFHDATTKGGPWLGVSDWDDELKPICDMTGVTCDEHGHEVEIALKGRRLEGHIPDEIGFLSFLERLDVSDNDLMGYVPSDLQWTSMTRLDISGNKIRGIVPPLLCMMEDLNGNGEDNVFYCDRVACPMGTYNIFGFHHGVSGETCLPCFDETPFIAQKACKRTKEPGSHFFQMAEKTSEEMGVSPGTALGIVICVLLIAIALCWTVKYVRSNPRKKYDTMENTRGNMIQRQDSNDEEDEDDIDDYSFNVPEHPRYRDKDNRDFVIADDDNDDEENHAEGGDNSVDYDDDDNMSRATTRSRGATDLINDHQGMALNRREKLNKAVSGRIVSGRMSGDISRRAREAASSINVGARRLSAQRGKSEGNINRGSYDYNDGEGNVYDDGFRTDLELVTNNYSSSSSYTSGDVPSAEKNSYKTKRLPSDLLDVPMIT